MRRLVVLLATATALGIVQPALAERDPYPHDFNKNMGYCAPFLAQQRLPNGDQVRPFINDFVQDRTKGDASFEGFENLGDFYSDKAREEEDQQCLAR